MGFENSARDRAGKTNILIAQKFPSPGGSQMSLVHHLEFLDRGAFIPRVVVAREGWLTEKLSSMRVPWDVMPFGHWTNLGALHRNILLVFRLAAYIRRHNIGLVHANEHWVAPLCLLAARITGVPVICHFRTGLEDLTPARIRKYLFSRYDRVIVVADVLKRALTREIKHPERVSVVRDGVETAGGTPASHGGRKKRIAITVGRVYPVKGQEKVLERALPWLRESRLNFLFFVGDTKVDRPYSERISRTVEANGLQRQVLFLGVRHDIQRLMGAADVLVAYSTVEGVPRVVMEAMLAGRPVLVSNTPGMEEVVEDGVNGRVIDFDAPANGLLEALRDIGADCRRWESMGERARAKALAEFSAEAMSLSIQRIYKNLTGEV